MDRRIFFVCGTDTGVGKTYASVALLRAGEAAGLRTLGLKPVASGAQLQDGRLVNEDALSLMRASTLKLPYEQVNPICLEEAVAPHIAAAHAGKSLNVNQLLGRVRGVLAQPVDFIVLEGAGGWRVPLGVHRGHCLSALPLALGCPVILVVGLRLGCLSHALLTAEAIGHDGLELAGWVANTLDPAMPAVLENIHTLQNWIQAPCLGILPFASEPVYTAVDLSAIMG